MTGIVDKLTALLFTLKDLLVQYFFIGFHWMVKLLKVQLQKMKRAKNMKHLEKAYSGLGAEVYALYKNGESDWSDHPSIANNITRIEQEEQAVFAVDQVIQQITEQYQQKKEALKAKRAQKKAAEGEREEDGQESA